MTCQACGTPNEDGRKFCKSCGQPLALVCASCGAVNTPDARFCGECGSVLTEVASSTPTAAAPSTGASSTERRLVSVLFLDLVSFTTLSESRDAEDMRALMDAYFETASTAIERHGGVVEKFIGDAVMAVWGTPVTHEDDAERAVRAALELVDAVAALGDSVGVPLQARAGVLTGEAATSPGAGNQGMVTGDMVNTASRLQSAAAPGQVFVGAPTHRAASRAIAFEEAGELDLKGKGAAVEAWRALRVIAERHGANRVAIEPPFVGRTEELRLLKELLHATGRESKARLASVSGIGGIGKSRLSWELLKYVDGLTEDIYWHQGRCPAYGDGITFWALGEMVRMRAGIAETDAPGVSRTKLAASVAELVPDEEERRWLEPRLAFLLGLEERPAGGGEELFAAWRAFFERISDRGTVVMVFEDLQWADEGLLDFVESLLEWSRTKPISIVTLSRPELIDRRPNWGAAQRNFVALHLEPLSDEAMAELVRAMIPGAADGAVERIVERAEGVPLYAVETIRMLADRGMLRAGEDAYEVVGDIDLGGLNVPETLHALIASRLDALGPGDRALLQDAAVVGKSFRLETLAAVTGAEAAALEPRLADLCRKEFLGHQVDPRSPERGQYGFVQSIIREVAYGMLSKADRRGRHLAVAHHFEAVGDDELAGVVAAHYVEALAATPAGPDADALAARARDALGLAAERATSLGSPIQALAFAEQALSITPNGRERADLLLQASTAAWNALRREERVTYLREAVDVLHGLGDVNAEVATMGLLASAYGDHAETDQLRTLVDAMRERLGDGGDDLARAELAHAMAILEYYERDYEASLASVDRALTGFERVGSRARCTVAISEKSSLLGMVGRRRESMLLIQGRLAVGRDENDLGEVSRALSSLGVSIEEMTASLATSLEAAAVARRGGYGESEMNALGNAVEAAVETGEWATADRIIEDLRARADLPLALVDILEINTALLAAYRGERDAAEVALAGIRVETSASDDPQLRAWSRRTRALVLLMRGDVEDAYEEAILSIDGDPTGPNAPLAVWVGGHAALWLRDVERARGVVERAFGDTGWSLAGRRSFEAGIMALEGHPREAAASYDVVLAGRLTVGDPFAHAQMVVDAATVLPMEVLPEDTVASARTYLEGIGAAPLLARLDQSVVAASRS